VHEEYDSAGAKAVKRFIVISGSSGAGKTVALHALEDLGFYGVDNLPLRLLPYLAEELSVKNTQGLMHAAVVIDVRSPGGDLVEFPRLLESIQAKGFRVQVLFLEADRNALLMRFSETRRKHPLSEENTPLSEALDREAHLLQPVRTRADLILDTSLTNVHQLVDLLKERVGRKAEGRMSVTLQSFGFKHGAPRDADMLFDVRCLPNPYWQAELRGLTGLDKEVGVYLRSQPEVLEMMNSLEQFLAPWIPRFERENRAYLSIAIGCTGGRHRSVFLVEALAARFCNEFPGLIVRHRELEE